MPLDGCRDIIHGDSCVKIIDAVTYTGEDEAELITKESVIANLAIVKFKYIAKKTDGKLTIELSFSECKQKLVKKSTIKINITSVKLLQVFKHDFEASETWSDWHLMGCTVPNSQMGSYVTLFVVYINAFEIKLDKQCLMLHSDTDFTDFSLATTEGATVAVHKACLAAHSEVFKHMLTGEGKETAEGKINIKGVSLETLQHLKEYMYLGTVPDDGLRPLLLIARCYLIEDLEKRWRNCIKYGDSSVKITDAITYTGKDEAELITKETVIANLAIVKFKWTTKKTDGKLRIEFHFSACKHKLVKDSTIKMNITSDWPKYLKRDFEAPETWSGWQSMGSVEPSSQEGSHGTVSDVYINAFAVKLDKLCLMLYSDTIFTDFYLATTEGATVAVHKACLAAHSEVFKHMLTGEWKETAEGKINIKGVSLETLQHLKEYMYLGTVPDDGLRPLLLIARCYLIEDLEKRCIIKLADTVLPEDLFSLIEFACENNIPELSYAMLQITRDSVITKVYTQKFEMNEEKD